ncbi:AraC family transcriptional regulator [Formosa algae]|uniref:AraC-like DNA-binding protein n=1 Tax=Formosa algae TaxID=225843 RepID=A0A9X1C8E3_9FLAO|nr:AraC family transcriptional regulator [Formosa algae]MBP1839146.1 AraC-like DNA-binding protein [Formosa algae]MDQ0333923.1 AraC-like DNA-binding protein [Formosa algae]OEI79661.1 cupin [Formosa algae]
MKVLPFKIPKPQQNALVFQDDLDVIFYDKLHQHEEIQLSLIVSGEGSLIVGDTINHYETGDILIIGSNLPHVFISDEHTTKPSHMMTLFFTKHAFGPHFFDLVELEALEPFFKRAEQGFKVTSKKKQVTDLFYALKTSSKLECFIILIRLLQTTATTAFESLSSYSYDKRYTDNEGKRMRDVFEYTMTHFNQDITLETISEVAVMTKNAFCKYFKKRTNKTYFQFLNELRIEHACKLIVKDNDLSISEIAYRSGFKNISNFNRQFKSVKGGIPSAYKRR